MSYPKKLTKYEAAEEFAPLVWPMLHDSVVITGPRAGNVVTSGVTLSYNGAKLTVTVEQYELFRVEVLTYFSDNYWLKPMTPFIPKPELMGRIQTKILEVFENE